jgi:isopenicillin N synthase-like dioxygenase
VTIVADTHFPPIESLPIIDLAPWYHDDTGKRLIASQVHFACLNTGFFYIKNHGIPASVIENTFQAAHKFFLLPEEVKLRVHFERTHFLRGYIPLRGEGKNHGGDLKEAFDCAPEYTPPCGIDCSTTHPPTSYWERMYEHNFWPE